MTGVLQDVRYALRTLARKPGFAGIIVLTLALGIGGGTAIFSVVRGVLLRELPYRDSARIVHTRGSIPDLRDLQAGTALLADSAITASNLYNLDAAPGGETEQIRGDVVGPGFFSTLGVAPILGRTFAPAEDRVVEDVKYQGLDARTQATLYTPYAQTPSLWMYVVVRTSGEPAALARVVREAIASVDPQQPVAHLAPLEELITSSVSQPRFNVIVLLTFALSALLLALVGIYGVLSYLVGERTREIGIRMALGARERDVVTMVLGHGLRLTALGIVLGAGGALFATRLLTSLLYGTSPTEPMVFVGAAALFALVASLACLVPAWRASRVDPVVALRSE